MGLFFRRCRGRGRGRGRKGRSGSESGSGRCGRRTASLYIIVTSDACGDITYIIPLVEDEVVFIIMNIIIIMTPYYSYSVLLII